MKKTVRVSPRNIQFNDDIQIREIPSQNNEDFQSVRRLSWDPNLTDKDLFKEKPTKQRNVIIGFVICGVVLLAIVIGTVLGIVLSQKGTTTADNSLTYNDACKSGSNQCKSSQGLYCPYGFCSCPSPYSWNTITQTCTLLSYNQACVTSNQCNSSLGLNCSNLICQCDNYHFWNTQNNTCILILNNTLNYDNQCAMNSGQCNSTVGLICTGNCTCQNGKVWNISTCVCPIGTFLNSSNLCQTAYLNNISCIVGSNQCDSTKNLSCNTNTSLCQCDSDQYWAFSIPTCLPRVNYSQPCSSSSDCIPTLICPTVPGVCTCPEYLADYLCNCADTKYYNSTISQCVDRATFNGTCLSSANYTCQLTLYCNAGVCTCPTGTSWIAANSTCA